MLPSEQQVEQYLADDSFRFDSVHIVTRRALGRVRFSDEEEDTPMTNANGGVKCWRVGDEQR